MKNLRKKSYQKIQKLDNQKTFSGYLTKACLRLAVFVSALPFYLFMRPSNSFEIMAVRKNDGTFIESYHSHLVKRKLSLGSVIALFILAIILVASGSIAPTGHEQPVVAAPVWQNATITADGVNFEDISALDNSHVWAVGWQDKDGHQARVYYYDGSNWNNQSPSLPGGITDLFGVYALDATHVWAVGNGSKIIFFNGATWSEQANFGDGVLRDVYALSASDVYAVGTTGPQARVAHFNGAAWAEESLPAGPPSATDLYGVWKSPDGSYVMAVGSSGEAGRASYAKYSGDSWTVADAPVGVTRLEAVDGADATHLWATGWLAGPPPVGKVLFYNGSNWSFQSYGPGIDPEKIYGVAMTSPTKGWAVGTKPGGGFAMSYNEPNWNAAGVPEGTPMLTGVDFIDANNGWASGYNGKVLKYGEPPPTVTVIASQNKTAEGSPTPLRFTFQVTPAFPGDTDVNFILSNTAKNGDDYPLVSSPITINAGLTTKALDILTTQDAFIEGDEIVQIDLAAGAGYQLGSPNKATATIQDDDDQNWNNRPTGVSYELTGVSMFDASNVWATGRSGGESPQGKILYFNGQYWVEQEMPKGFADVHDVSAIAADNVYAVADSGNSAVLRYNGQAWSVMEGSPQGISTLKGIHARNGSDVWIVGGKNGPPPFDYVVYQYNGSSWIPHTLSGGINVIRAVYALDSTHVWVVGQKSGESEATIWFYNGSAWAEQALPAGIADLYDVYAVAADNVWTVGTGTPANPGAKILRFNGSEWSLISKPASFSAIYGVSGMSGSSLVWIVGTHPSSAGSIAVYNGGSVFGTQSVPEGAPTLKSVSMLDATHGFAVGLNGKTISYGAFPPQTAPTASSLSASHNSKPESIGKMDLFFTIFDVNYNGVEAKLEYSPDNGANWYDPYLNSVKGSGEPGLNNDNEYQISSITTPYPNQLEILWDTRSAQNGNGSMNNNEYANVKFRVTPRDDQGSVGSATPSDSFKVDNKTPQLDAITLNDGAEGTSNRGVNVGMTLTEGNPYQCMDSESDKFDTGLESWKPWANCTGTTIYSAGGGTKTIYRKVKDLGYNVSSVKSDSINLDIPPTPWSIQSIPAGTSALNSVDGSGADFVVAVGAGGSPQKGRILKYDGSSWGLTNITDASTLQGVSVLNNNKAWAAGNDGGNPIKGMIYSYNGTAWSKDSIPSGGQDFKAVSALDTTHVWAVGAGDNPTGDKVYFYNGSAWSKQTVPAGVHVLSAVSAADATHVWAGGGDGKNNGVMIFYNGSAWSKQTLPEGIAQINAIYAQDATHVWAGGTNNQSKGTVLFYDGKDWATQGIPAEITLINGVYAFNQVIRAVGQSGGLATIIEYGAKGWSNVSNPLGYRWLSSIYTLDDKNAWAVGQGIGTGAVEKFTPLNKKPVLIFQPLIRQAKDGSGKLEVWVKVSDDDGNNVDLNVYYSTDQGKTWYRGYIVNVLAPDIPNNKKPEVKDPNKEPRQVKNIPCDQLREIALVWDPKSSKNEGGSLDDVELSDLRIKVSPFDGTDLGDEKIKGDIPLDLKKPDFIKIKPSNEQHDSVVITWDTDEAATSQVRFTEDGDINSAASTDDVDWDYTDEDTTLVASHSVKVTGLKPFTAYAFQTISADVYGNEEISSTDEFITTDEPDTTKPVISGVTTTTTTTTATVTWDTDEAATSQVEYGKTTDYGSETTLDATLLASHSVVISGLKPETTYHFRVKSVDGSDNEKVSKDYTFTTKSGTDTTEPVISGVAVAASKTTATVVWTTDEPATSRVEYGKTTDYGSLTTLDTDLDTSHAVELGNLFPGTTYHFRVRSKDDLGNLAVSDDAVFATQEETDVEVPKPTDIGFNGGTLPADTTQPAINNNFRPSFSGTTCPRCTVTLYIYSDPKVYSTKADSDGAWSITPSEDLETGEHEVYIQITDTEGNSSAKIKIGTIAIIPAGEFVIWPREGAIATTQKPVIKGLAPSGHTVKVYIDDAYNGQAQATIHSSGTGHFAYTPFVDLILGAHTAKIVVENSQGIRTHASDNITFHLERPYVSPVITRVTDLDTPKPKIWGLAKSGSTVQIFIDYKLYGEFQVTDASGTASFVYEPFLNLKPGVHTVYAVAKDSRGKSSNIASKQHITVGHPTVQLEEPRKLTTWEKVTHIVKAGDCLWSLAKDYYGDGSLYNRIIELNKAKYPSIVNTIIVDGWELIIQ